MHSPAPYGNTEVRAAKIGFTTTSNKKSKKGKLDKKIHWYTGLI